MLDFATNASDHPRRSLALGAATLLLAFVAGCGGPSSPTPPSDGDDDLPVAVPARGLDETLDVATWNVEWFGDPGNGPSDDVTQLRRVRDVILGSEIDVWALQEIVDPTDFEALLAELPGYDGLLATDPAITEGATWYGDFGGNEQKVGVIWRTDEITFVSGRVVLGESDYDFAGRPPLELRLHASLETGQQDMVLLVLHAKASTDAESWERRRNSATALKAWLDTTWPEANVYVAGDFNDDVDTSIRVGSPSPWAIFVDDRTRWRFVTDELSAAGASSTVAFSDVIDHILVSNEVAARYVSGSAEAYRLDLVIDGYANSTSDHYPVLARFRIGN